MIKGRVDARRKWRMHETRSMKNDEPPGLCIFASNLGRPSTSRHPAQIQYRLKQAEKARRSATCRAKNCNALAREKFVSLRHIRICTRQGMGAARSQSSTNHSYHRIQRTHVLQVLERGFSHMTNSVYR